MSFRERRHQERTTPNGLVYIDLKPDNGGIVLNVSDRGVCFQSVAPVKKHERFTFSFHECGLRGDGIAEVAWTDKTSKVGGLRFTQVSAEAPGDSSNHKQQEEIAEPVLSAVQEECPSALLTAELPTLTVQEMSPLHTALLREANPLPIPLPLSPKHPYKQWAIRIAVALLAIYAVWASAALYRYSRRSISPTQVATAPKAESTPSLPVRSPSASRAKPSSVAAEEPSPEVVHYLNKPMSPKPAVLSPDPARPVIRTAPVKFDYPLLAGGSPSGHVDLKLLIGTTGAVESVKVLAGNPDLAKAARTAATGWRYRPLVLNGQPVLAEAHVRMNFAGNEAISISFRQ